MVKITVIIPCYNQGEYIAECLGSVIEQTFTDWEAIVVNDGSIDNSLAIIEEYAKKDKRIKILNQTNQGVIVARNNAIKEAKGEFIYPLDGDDKIAPECLELLYKAFLDGKGDVVYSEVEYFGNKSGIMLLKNPTKFNMLKSNCLTISALFKKSDALKYGGYDPKMKDGLEDWEFWFNFLCGNKKFYKVHEVLFFYRQSVSSRNNSFDFIKMLELRNYIFNKHNLWAMFNLILILNFLYQHKITKSNKRLIKICKIPVYSRRVK